MEKKYLKIPEDTKERIFLFIGMARMISGKITEKDELIRAFNSYGIEFNDELKLELIDRFPEIDLD